MPPAIPNQQLILDESLKKIKHYRLHNYLPRYRNVYSYLVRLGARYLQLQNVDGSFAYLLLYRGW